MGTLTRILAGGLGLLVIVGCYYYEEDYLRGQGKKGPYTGRRTPYSNPAYSTRTDPGATWGPSQPAPPAPASDFPSHAEEAVEDEERLVEAGVIEEGYDLIVRIVGVSPEEKGKLERDVRALEGVESVVPLSYESGELGLGLKYSGPVRALHGELAGLFQFRAKRFMIELRGEVEAVRDLKVRIFAPAEGSRLASTTVFVGIEVEGVENPTVIVNGIPAEPLGAPGRYRARIICQPGENSIIAVAKGTDGRSARAHRNIFVSEGEAAVDESSLTILIQGKVDDPLSTVTVDGKPVKVNPDGTYRVEITLKDDQEFVTVVSLDSLGNKKIRKIPVAGK